MGAYRMTQLPDPILADWLTTPQAAKALSISVGTLYGDEAIRDAIEHKSAAGKSPRGVGGLWKRNDIERLIELRNRFGLPTRTAARGLLHERKTGSSD